MFFEDFTPETFIANTDPNDSNFVVPDSIGSTSNRDVMQVNDDEFANFVLNNSLNSSSIGSTFINEIVFNPPGTDVPNEYIELRGIPNATLAQGTYLVGIEGDAGTPNPGDVQNIFNLSGLSFGANGLLVLAQKNNTYSVDPLSNVVTNTGTGAGWGSGVTSSLGHSSDGGITELEGASVTFMLIETAIAPTLATDIDANNDGIPDGTAWSNWTILDSVSILDGASTDTAYGNIVFRAATSGGRIKPGATVVNTIFIPEYVARSSNTIGYDVTDWVVATLHGIVPNWTLNASTIPTLAGRALDHIGRKNFNMLPILDLNGISSGNNFINTFTRSMGAVAAVDSGLTVTDRDDAMLSSATIQITNLLDGNFESLIANTNGTNITATYNSATATLNLNGNDTVSNYQQVLRSITYNNTDVVLNSTNRNIEFKVFDEFGSSSTVSTTMTINSPTIQIGDITNNLYRSLDSVSDTYKDDLYKFSIAANSNVSLILTVAGGDANLALYDSNSNLLGSSTNAGTSGDIITYYNLAAGDYYYQVIHNQPGVLVNYRTRIGTVTV